MRRLAALFSGLCILAMMGVLWLLWSPRPVVVPGPVVAPRPEVPGWHLPGLPELRLPRLPDLPDLSGLRPPTRPQMPIASPVERILVEKGARRMTVYQRAGQPRVFRIALGFTPEGDKARQGDGRTPEGIFHVDRLNRQSAYHLSLGLDYPQRRHRDAARQGGFDPGGDIMIHGQPNQVPEDYRVKGDWTAGCIALTNPEIEEIFAHAAIGTEVEIRP